MNDLIFSQIPINDLRVLIQESVREEMQKNSISEPQPKTEFITRQETSSILGISLPTLNEWTKKGLIPGYRISSRVRYKRAEIMESLTKINTLKYRRD
ncbi:MAG: helix-turn-helix domain-containing protein [Bacteroidetes bacterium]|nr:helix-turn-helix domain-containing protein [Bacteroidota bacterium]